jgi:ribosomal protein S27AE
MHDIDTAAGATKDCARCGGRAFYWRSAVMPGDPQVPSWRSHAVAHHQPAWTCMNCGYIEPHDRRQPITRPPEDERRRL